LHHLLNGILAERELLQAGNLAVTTEVIFLTKLSTTRGGVVGEKIVIKLHRGGEFVGWCIVLFVAGLRQFQELVISDWCTAYVV